MKVHFKDQDKFEGEFEDSKKMGVLEICLDKGSKIKRMYKICTQVSPERVSLWKIIKGNVTFYIPM